MNTTNSRKEAVGRQVSATFFIHRHSETFAMILVLALSALIGGMAV